MNKFLQKKYGFLTMGIKMDSFSNDDEHRALWIMITRLLLHLDP